MCTFNTFHLIPHKLSYVTPSRYYDVSGGFMLVYTKMYTCVVMLCWIDYN